MIGLTKSVAADDIGATIRSKSAGPGTVDSPGLRERIWDLAVKMADTACRLFTGRQPAGRFSGLEC